MIIQTKKHRKLTHTYNTTAKQTHRKPMKTKKDTQRPHEKPTNKQ